ncbi:MAG: PilZ domain-containing protein [Pseudomonadota bacterium]|nr:PilZ domain-containing protein [Pseudomonadota bacterium]
MNKFRAAILGGGGVAPSTPLVTGKRGGKADGEHLASVDIPRDASRSIDHRDEDRHRLARETATIGYKGKLTEVDLINLSGGGAMIEADITLRLWDRVDLYLGAGTPIESAVRWLRGGRIGVEFAHETRIECAPEQRDALLLDVIRRSFPDLVATVPKVESEPEAGPADATRRGDIRHPLIWNGNILWRHDIHTVRLRNISASGALIDSRIDLPEGAELMLDLGASGQLFATVGWSRGGQSGLIFKQPFDLAVLAKVKPDVAPQRWDKPSYLDLSPAQASPWASGWGRSDMSNLRADLEGFLKR